jgi:hypothetical protein
MLLVDAPAVPRDPVLLEIEGLPVDSMTPLEALTLLCELQKRMKDGNSVGPEKCRHTGNPAITRDSADTGQEDKPGRDPDRSGQGGR